MTETKYDVISPDGFPISCHPFNSTEAALKAIPVWCERFKAKGYYLDNRWNKIPLEYLPEALSVVPVSEDDFDSGCGCNGQS